jgi:membrane-bound lytic murein transglycosylase D
MKIHKQARMRIFVLPLVFIVIAGLNGCSLLHRNVDQLSPMVPATEQPAGDNNPLVKNMPEPAPEVPPGKQETNLWLRLASGFSLIGNEDNNRIDVQRAWFANHQAYLDRVATRAQRYLYYVTEQVQSRHMPLELALLPVVESAFDPFAYSRGRASGPWQFIPSTGRHFDLTQNWWYDGRRDIVASTQAALTYLQQLADRFDGDWLLALASYNAGAITVSRAIARNQSRGLPTDFWHLNLPRETSAYVPKLLAIAQLVANPGKYGITLPVIPNTPYFAIIDTGGQLDLSQAAKMADISVEELYMLNPGFNRWATPPGGPNRLLVPVQHEATFETELAKLPEDERIRWSRYAIKPGDSLISISHHQNVPIAILRQVNHIEGNTIVAGDTLLIPKTHGKGSYASALEKNLVRHNQPSGGNYITYRVRSGDSLWTIARHHHVRVSDLMAWNHLNKHSLLHPGQSLRLWTRKPFLARDTTRRVRYAVRNGDSLYAIADRFNVSVSAIQRWNNISASNYLQPGQHLTLYVDVRNVD